MKIPATRNYSIKSAARGFTLIEMIVAVGIFMFVMVIAIGSLVAIVGADRKAQSIEAVVDNLRFALDDVSREVRTGTDYYCGGFTPGGTGDLADCPNGSSAKSGGVREITVTDQDNNRVAYRIEPTASMCGAGYTGGCLMRCTYDPNSPGANCLNSGFLSITSSEIDIDAQESDFYVVGSSPKSQGNTTQPKVVMTLSAFVTQGVSTQTKLHLQTTITQRIYDGY